MGLLRSLDHNQEQIVWAEQTEIELTNFLNEFDETVWPLMHKYGYSKDTALTYWMFSHALSRLSDIEAAVRDDHEGA